MSNFTGAIEMVHRRHMHVDEDPQEQKVIDEHLCNLIQKAESIEIAPGGDDEYEQFEARCKRNERYTSKDTPFLLKWIKPAEIEVHKRLLEYEQNKLEDSQNVLVPECVFKCDGKFFILMRTADSNLFLDLKADELETRNKFQTDTDEIHSLYDALMGAIRFLNICGVTHLDIKPQNVLLLRGRYVIADFGNSAPCGRAVSTLGTPAYWPPEAFTTSGDVALTEAAFACDYWAVALVICACVKKALPWDRACSTDLNFAKYKCAKEDLHKGTHKRIKLDGIPPYDPETMVNECLWLSDFEEPIRGFILDALEPDPDIRADAITKRLEPKSLCK